MPRKFRQERIGDLLLEQVAAILHEEFNAPEDTVMTVTGVSVADDLETAAVSVSVFPDDARDEAMERLVPFAGEVQHMLLKRLRIKPIPRIRFVPDKGVSHADKIDRALKDVENKNSAT